MARRPDAVTNPQFWAEDGSIYFQENLTIGFVPAFIKLYRGYPNLSQRLIAVAGGWVPFASAPRVYTSLAIAVTAMALASFCLPRFQHIVRSDALRLGFCIACVCVPAGVESFATPTNVGWFLAVWLFLLSLARLPSSPWHVVALSVGGAIAVFSTPLAVAMAPLWVLRAVAAGARRDRHERALALSLLAALAIVLAMSRNLGIESDFVLDVPGQGIVPVRFQWVAAWNGIVYVLGAVFLSTTVLDAAATQHRWLLQVGALALIVIIVGAAAAESRRRLAIVLACFYGIVAAVVLMLLGRPPMNAVLGSLIPRLYPGRYVVFPAALVVLSVAVVVDGLGARRRPIAAALLGGTIALAWGPSFRLPPLADLQWPMWASRLDAKIASGSDDPLTIPVNGAQRIRLDAVRRDP